MTTILVTGAAGFVAHHLTNLLRRTTSARLIGVDVRHVSNGIYDDFVTADLSVPSAIARAFEITPPDLIFHLAGLTNGTEEAIYASNAESARHLLDVARNASLTTRIVLLGSAAEYGNVPTQEQPVRETFIGTPQGAYGRAKSTVAELAARASTDFDMHVVVARPFNIVGAGIPPSLMVGAVVDRIRDAIAGPVPYSIRIGNTSAVRDFVAVEDVVDGLVRVAERGRPGQAYNLCSGVGVRVGEVVERLIEISGEPIAVERDATLLRPGEVNGLVGSWEKAKLELAWAPITPLHASLRAAWQAKGTGK